MSDAVDIHARLRLPFPASHVGVDFDAYTAPHYYDLGLTLSIAYYRSGDVRFRDLARKVSDSWWLMPNINGGTTNEGTSPQSPTPRTAGIGGLMLRALDGRPEMWPWLNRWLRDMNTIWLSRWLTSPVLVQGVRDGGYTLTYLAWAAKVHPDPVIRAEMLQKAKDAAVKYYARLQHPDGGWYWEFTPEWVPQGGDMFGSNPFHVGLLLEGLIATHQLTGDTTIARTIIKSVDWFYAKAFEQQPVTNLTTGVRWRAMKYLVYRTNPTINDRTTAERWGSADGAVRDERQLNPDVLHAYGYAFKLTGDPKYIVQGDEIFASTFGKGRGPGSDAYWGLADFRGKEFNQSYRSSGKYLAWRIGVP